MNKDDIKALRKRLGLTQQALADKLGCPQQTVARWESGKHPISNAYAQVLRLLAP